MAATPGSMTPSIRLDAHLHYIAGNEKKLTNRTQVRVHVGTREILGRVSLMETDTIMPGNDSNVQLLLQEPVAVWPGDHYVIRSYSPISTIGGGIIYNNAPRKRKRTVERDRIQNIKTFALYSTGTPEEKLLLFLEESGFLGIVADQLATRLGIFGKKLKKLLQQPISTGKIVVVDSDNQRFVAASVLKKLTKTLLALLSAYHEANPLKTGLAKEELRSQLKPRPDQKLLNYALNYLSKKGEIIQEKAEIRLTGHEVTLQVDEQAMREQIGNLYLKAELKPANLKDVLAKFTEFPEEQIRQVIDLLLQDGEIIKINEALYFHTSVLDKLKDQVVDFIRKEGEIDAPRFKNMTGLTRKFSIPLLEYFDKIKLTIRIEDKRVLRKG